MSHTSDNSNKEDCYKLENPIASHQRGIYMFPVCLTDYVYYYYSYWTRKVCNVHFNVTLNDIQISVALGFYVIMTFSL